MYSGTKTLHTGNAEEASESALHSISANNRDQDRKEKRDKKPTSASHNRTTDERRSKQEKSEHQIPK